MQANDCPVHRETQTPKLKERREERRGHYVSRSSRGHSIVWVNTDANQVWNPDCLPHLSASSRAGLPLSLSVSPTELKRGDRKKQEEGAEQGPQQSSRPVAFPQRLGELCRLRSNDLKAVSYSAISCPLRIVT